MDHYFTNSNDLKSEIKKVTFSYNEYDFVFFSDNGVFSKSHIDYGSKVLLETFLKSNEKPKSILDVGCGYGFMGIVLAKVLNSSVTMSDVNRRALHLTNMSAKENGVDVNVIESSCYDNITGKYDLIITNPPVRAGKRVVLEILEGAKEHLNEGGSLWYVLRKDQGAKSIEKTLKENYEIENVKKSNGFYIFCCKKVDRLP